LIFTLYASFAFKGANRPTLTVLVCARNERLVMAEPNSA
jgi:hypothetical protein